jgi:hypothetical protein
MNAALIGSTNTSSTTPSPKKLARQPRVSMSTVAIGMMTSWLADIAPPTIPNASPRRASNHRAITAAPVGWVARPQPP